jgi:hypothetical protein
VEPLEAAQPARTAGTTHAAAVSAMTLVRFMVGGFSTFLGFST